MNPLPSGSIRLLLLQPRSAASPSNEVNCSLQSTTLSDHYEDLSSHYTALSYVWGNAEDCRTILLNGFPFKVTANLFCALRDIRNATKELLLWAYAIYINQSDVKERNQQVSLMGSTHAAAAHTIIYLGESDESSERAIRVLKRPDRGALFHRGQLFNDEKENIVSSILSRPWFTRVWVLQELALSQAPTIQCGTSCVKWAALYRILGIKTENNEIRLSFSSSKSKLHGLSKPSDQLDSWAPDWTLRTHQHINPISTSSFLLRRDIAPNTVERSFWVENSPVMGVVGRRHNRITDLSEVINWYDSSLPRTRLSVETSKETFKGVYEQWLDRLGRQLLSPLPERWESEYMSPSLRSRCYHLRKPIFPGQGRVIQLSEFSGDNGMRGIVGGRRVARLCNGRNAIVPASTEWGDVVFEINFGHNPVVLRDFVCTNNAPIDDETRARFAAMFTNERRRGFSALYTKVISFPVGRYQFVGECLVDPIERYQSQRLQVLIEGWKILALH